MILISLVLVLISAVALLVGGLGEGTTLIYVSIGAALAAGLFLLLGVIRGGRRPKPNRAAKTVASPDEAPAATWRAASTDGDPGVLSRDDLGAAPPTSEAPVAVAPATGGNAQAPPAQPQPAPRSAPAAGTLPPPAPAAGPAGAPTPTPTPPTAPPRTSGGSWAPPPPPTAPPGSPGGPPPPPA